jgi:PleD family two-component response regulator
MSATITDPRPLILVIDDDDMIHLMLNDILSSEGFEVLGVTSGQAGLEIMIKHCPDLVLLDVMMPEMDGFACLEALRAIPKCSLLPIVMLTGVEDMEAIHRSFSLGATDFIAKPINWTILPYRVRYLLRTSEAFRKLARNEAVLHNAQKIAHLGNWDWEVSTDQMTCSTEAFKVLGIVAENFNGHRLDLFKTVHPSDVHHLHQAMGLCTKQGRAFSLDIRLGHTVESAHIAHIQGEAEMHQGRIEKVHGTVQDITERRQIEDKVHHLSNYDRLTNLPNRTLFNDRLGVAFARARRHRHKVAAPEMIVLPTNGFFPAASTN